MQVNFYHLIQLDRGTAGNLFLAKDLFTVVGGLAIVPNKVYMWARGEARVEDEEQHYVM